MTEPNKELLSDERIPTVSVGGKVWPIPKLAPKQNEIVLPILVARSRAGALTAEAIHDLYTALYWCLQRGHKSMTREEFDDMPIGVDELYRAMTVMGEQTGLMTSATTGANGTPIPLAKAAASSPTGEP